MKNFKDAEFSAGCPWDLEDPEGFAGWLINTILALDNPAISAWREEQQLNFIRGSDQICNPMWATPHHGQQRAEGLSKFKERWEVRTY